MAGATELVPWVLWLVAVCSHPQTQPLIVLPDKDRCEAVRAVLPADMRHEFVHGSLECHPKGVEPPVFEDWSLCRY